jgi:hypothetical protein
MPFLIAVVTVQKFPRGKYIGTGNTLASVSDSPPRMRPIVKCPGCGGLIDCRDLAQVFEHEGPLPHPAQDQPQHR